MTIKQQNTLTLTTVQLSGAISLPVLMAGYFVGSHYQTDLALIQIIVSNVILFICAYCYAAVAFQHKETTVMLAARFFGERGVVICALGMLMLMLGWSVIQLNYMTSGLTALLNLTSRSSQLALAAASCFLLYLSIARGLHYFAKISQLLMPIFILALGLTLYDSFNTAATSQTLPSFPIMAGFIIIMSTASGLLFDLPTYYRHAVTLKAARQSLTLLFLFIIPGMQCLGVYLAKTYSLATYANNDMTSIFKAFSASGLVFFLLSSFLSNCINWYSAATICNQFIKLRQQVVLPVIAILCFLGSMINITDYLLPLLELINIIGELILCLILVYVFFNGANLKSISLDQTQQHTNILYFILACLLATRVLPIPLAQDSFVTAALLSITLMTITCMRRKFV
jgi:purine-cytosine permease-like protein